MFVFVKLLAISLSPTMKEATNQAGEVERVIGDDQQPQSGIRRWFNPSKKPFFRFTIVTLSAMYLIGQYLTYDSIPTLTPQLSNDFHVSLLFTS